MAKSSKAAYICHKIGQQSSPNIHANQAHFHVQACDLPLGQWIFFLSREAINSFRSNLLYYYSLQVYFFYNLTLFENLVREVKAWKCTTRINE